MSQPAARTIILPRFWAAQLISEGASIARLIQSPLTIETPEGQGFTILPANPTPSFRSL